ncbi:kinase-like protein [Aspergillus japonicus CBS 114.51]|uniref:non-specific serine/threonine protein kinase n=1 Tax=Aspergillus japonicus CBS 114.51 TaxID=1448312 RepID=A0A8T8X484_ASPJA|nr:kinase-like protein [Aspergillus japonicus CBS 114.51]RAH82855.1 kinase-like protein [Aspergillus japonicus CBS 114.51]
MHAKRWEPTIFLRAPISWISTSTPLSPKSDPNESTASSSPPSPSPTPRPSKPQYRLIEDVEALHRYRPGGSPPLQVGDHLAEDRYQLVHKLGSGGYSTIWLARDLREARYVAVKTITADASDDTPEATLLHSLGPLPPRPGKEVFPPLLDDFWVAGCNGRHWCVVTPPARMSVFDAKEVSTFGLFRPRVAQSMIAQLIRGVSFLHSLGVVHDLHLGNILVQFPTSLDSIAPSELYERYGVPESEEVVRLDGKPLAEGVPARVFVPGWFGPPEARFSDEPLSFASDIWTLACTIWEILGQRPLFETFFPSPDRVTAEQVEVLGKLPDEWWGKWGRRLDWFSEEGELDLRRFEDSVQKPRAEVGFGQVA